MIRAKFKVETRTELANGGFVVKLLPVIEGSEENKQFFKWTPGGAIDLMTINAEAGARLKPGTQFYVDFTEAVPQ